MPVDPKRVREIRRLTKQKRTEREKRIIAAAASKPVLTELPGQPPRKASCDVVGFLDVPSLWTPQDRLLIQEQAAKIAARRSVAPERPKIVISEAIKRRRARVLTTWGPTCHLCGLEVVVDAPVSSPLSFTLDHITPKSKGGTLAMANIRPAHRFCNHSRGCRDLADLSERERDTWRGYIQSRARRKD